jgi:hypothetical protein
MSRPSFGELGGEDPFEILGLTPEAGDREIRVARRRLLRRYHPDVPGGDLRRTQMITAASHILLDPMRRRAYEDMLDELALEPAGAGARTHAAGRGAGAGRGGAVPGQRSAGPRTAGTRPASGSGSRPGPGPRAARRATADAPDSAAHNGTGPPGRHGTTGRRRRPRQPFADLLANGPQQHPDPTGGLPVPPWSALAIAATLAALTFTPVGLLLGYAALVQIRRGRRRGRTLAWLGILLGFALLAAYLVVLLVPTLGPFAERAI